MLAKYRWQNGLLAAGGSFAGTALGFTAAIIIWGMRGYSLSLPIFLAVVFTCLSTICFATYQTIKHSPQESRRTLMVTSLVSLLVCAVTGVECFVFLAG